MIAFGDQQKKGALMGSPFSFTNTPYKADPSYKHPDVTLPSKALFSIGLLLTLSFQLLLQCL